MGFQLGYPLFRCAQSLRSLQDLLCLGPFPVHLIERFYEVLERAEHLRIEGPAFLICHLLEALQELAGKPEADVRVELRGHLSSRHSAGFYRRGLRREAKKGLTRASVCGRFIVSTSGAGHAESLETANRSAPSRG